MDENGDPAFALRLLRRAGDYDGRVGYSLAVIRSRRRSRLPISLSPYPFIMFGYCQQKHETLYVLLLNVERVAASRQGDVGRLC